MTTAGLEDSPIARLILSQERAHTLPPSLPASAAHRGKSIASTLPIVILSEDPVFATQVRAALDSDANVTSVANLDEAVELAASGSCSILMTDTIITRSAIESGTRRLRAHDPALAFIVAGPRDHGGMFIGLQSSGAIDGFLLKPVTAGATQLLIESATKRHRSSTSDEPLIEPTRIRRPTSRTTPPVLADAAAVETIEAHVAAKPIAREIVAPQAAPAHARVPRPAWSLVLVALAIVAAGAWWLSSQRTADHDAKQVIADYLQRAEAAAQSGRWLGGRDTAAAHLQTVLALDPSNLSAQRGLDQVAVQLSKQVQAHVAEKRLAPAASVLERLREFQPDYAELPLLEAQLAILRDQVVAAAPPISPVIAEAKPPVVVEEAPAKTVKTIASRVREPSAQATLTPGAEIAAKAGTEDSSETSARSSATIDVPKQLPIEPELSAPIETPPTTPALNAEPAITEQSSAMLASLARVPSVPTQTTGPQAPTESLKLLKYVPPTYPSEAYARGIEGWIQVELQVAADGSVTNAQVRDGEKRQLFSRAALAAVKQWKYEARPHVNGPELASVRLEFQLKR